MTGPIKLRATAALLAGLGTVCAPKTWAQTPDADSDTVAANFASHARDTAVPAVPAAALLGVDKSKVIEVASFSKISTALSAGNAANAQGTPFGIDFSPGLLFADRGGVMSQMVRDRGTYRNSWTRQFIARTRISLASANRDNSRLSAWGYYTRLFDFRDPFVNPGLNACASKEIRRQLEQPAALTSLAGLVPTAPMPSDAQNLLNALGSHLDAAETGSARYQALSALKTQAQSAATREQPSAKNTSDLADLPKALATLLETFPPPQREQALKAASNCDEVKQASGWNRSYLAVGQSIGTGKVIDATQPLGVRPGRAFWFTFAYGFEGLETVWDGDAKWSQSKGLGADPSWRSQNARLLTHYSRVTGAQKLVNGVMSDASGEVLGLGLDVADGDTRRFSAQLSRSREGSGSTRNVVQTAVVGVDVKVQDSTWLGLSWGRRSVSSGSGDNEVKAQLKWAFSDNGWLSPP